MSKVEGLNNVSSALKSIASRIKPVQVNVGYSADYALTVHEDLERTHKPPGQAKFLEQPLRERQAQIHDKVKADLIEGKTLSESIEEVGQEVLAASQLIVPVKSGHLRDSGYCNTTN